MAVRRALAAGMVLVMAPAAWTAGTTKPEKPGWKVYRRHAFGKAPVAKSAAGALWDHMRTAPHEWGGGAPGLGKRFGSVFGGHLIKTSVHFTVSRALHEELEYRPSGKEGFTPRLKYALLSTVITHKTTTGKPTMATGEVAGVVTSGFVSRLWYPARLHTFAAGATSSGISLGVDAGSNVVREFWPEIRHPRQRLQNKKE